MLILQRNSNESIIIGDDIKITILSPYLKRVKIGIEAPKSTSVHREEIYNKIHKNQPKKGGNSARRT